MFKLTAMLVLGVGLAVDANAGGTSASPKAWLSAGDDLRQTIPLSEWKFQQVAAPLANCTEDTFPVDISNQRCFGLSEQLQVADAETCRQTCCGATAGCNAWQWCPEGATDCEPAASCWTSSNGFIDLNSSCSDGQGWVGEGSYDQPVPPDMPVVGQPCDTEVDPQCAVDFDDTEFETVSLPHDFVVTNTFSEAADKSHGYLPYGIGWYRTSFSLSADMSDKSITLQFDGAQTSSQVWLNGIYLGDHAYGYTPFSFQGTNLTQYLNFGDEKGNDGTNVLAVRVDATNPDSWWYDGGGLYREARVVVRSRVHLRQWGVYAAATVDAATISGEGSKLSADASLRVATEVEAELDGSMEGFLVMSTVLSPSGAVVAEGTVEADGKPDADGIVTAVQTWNLTGLQLWDVATPGNEEGSYSPHLYTVVTQLKSASGNVNDASNTTFGVRHTAWDADTGFSLNGKAVKILGTANHQDFFGVGVAVPDSLQPYRISRLQSFGVNGWRCAHNAPNEALLDAADRLGMLVWDENHRNGQPDEMATLIRRDRNHPSVVIWSLCNEVLCDTDNNTADGLVAIDVIHGLDPYGSRVISANNNDLNGPDTILDVQGYDYATSSYDDWHARAPLVPSISSETSSAVSDRGEYANDPINGYVTGYDTEAPSWGETAQDAWSAILEDDFMAGGFTWTGWDYKGEPTPYQWPNINSHFGIMDMAGFYKDRTYWYQAWYIPSTPLVHLVPDHWSWDDDADPTTDPERATCEGMCKPKRGGAGGVQVDVWAYGNTAYVELFLNGKSLGRQAMPQYGHVAWDAVDYAAGELVLNGYDSADADADVVTSDVLNTAGPAASLALELMHKSDPNFFFRGAYNEEEADSTEEVMVVVSAAVVDAAGVRVPTAAHSVAFTLEGTTTSAILGTGSGDPSDHTPDHASARGAFHGLVAALIRTQAGCVSSGFKVAASADGLESATLAIGE